MYRLRSKSEKKDNHDIYKGIKAQSWKSKRFHSLVFPKYKLMEDLVHHILSRCDVHNGLCRDDKFFDQVLMLLRAIAHQETSLHGVELIPDLDLCRSQCLRRAMMNAMKSDLLKMGQNIMEASVNEGTPSVDGVHGHVHR